MERSLTVGQLAETAGVKASTVRYYEQLGLLKRGDDICAECFTPGIGFLPKHRTVGRLTC